MLPNFYHRFKYTNYKCIDVFRSNNATLFKVCEMVDINEV